MPVVTLTVADAQHYSSEQFDQFVDGTDHLCRKALLADAEKIQIQIVGAIHPLHGRAAYISVQYRNNPHRTEAVMLGFMQAMEELCGETLGIEGARIRCFPQENIHLYARN